MLDVKPGKVKKDTNAVDQWLVCGSWRLFMMKASKNVRPKRFKIAPEVAQFRSEIDQPLALFECLTFTCAES
jgi:hypothetical protein